ncbi:MULTISPECIES: Imm74 family immunity protein [unclassified Pseudomonas]|uniref:Imm74 family immunity protein n=1 Tax=unclassified Pseudomonas TaxID=196821 RepID=UPI0034DCE34F
MILEVSRGHVRVQVGGRVVTVQGEMFFPKNEKMGFVLYRDSIRTWDKPNELDALTADEVNSLIAEIQDEFSRGGHTLEIET